jgi:integrase
LCPAAIKNPADAPTTGRTSSGQAGDEHEQAAYGSGSLYEKRGAWYGRWRDAAGGQFNRKVGCKRTPGERDGLTRKQAEEKFAAMRQAEGSVTAASRVTVGEAGAAWLLRLEAQGAKKSYVESVESIVRVHLGPYFATRGLHKIDEDDVERYVAVKRRQGLAPKTIRNHLGALHSIFQLGQRRKWCAGNAVKLADGPKVRQNTTRIQFLSQDELEAVVRGPFSGDAFGSVEPTLYLTAAMTGLRQGELLGLRWKNIDWTAEKIRVVQSYVRGEFNDPKSEGSARSVPLAPRIAAELERLSQRSPWQADDDLVFAHPHTGNPLNRSKLTKRFKEAEKRAGVPVLKFHELRHTFGTRCAAAGVNMRVLQAWMGHRDFKTTLIYARYAPSAGEADMVERAFSPGAEAPPEVKIA